MNYFFHAGEPIPVRHKVRRDYPRVGDSALSIFEQDEAQTCIFLVRPEEGNKVNFVVVVNVAENKFATWATFQLPGATSGCGFGGRFKSWNAGLYRCVQVPCCMLCLVHDTAPQVPLRSGVRATDGDLVLEPSRH